MTSKIQTYTLPQPPPSPLLSRYKTLYHPKKSFLCSFAVNPPIPLLAPGNLWFAFCVFFLWLLKNSLYHWFLAIWLWYTLVWFSLWIYCLGIVEFLESVSQNWKIFQPLFFQNFFYFSPCFITTIICVSDFVIFFHGSLKLCSFLFILFSLCVSVWIASIAVSLISLIFSFAVPNSSFQMLHFLVLKVPFGSFL